MGALNVEGTAATGSHNSTTKNFDESLALCRRMRVADLRTELGTRGISWDDCFEKEDLAQRLAGILAREAAFCTSGRISPGRVVQLTGDELDEELSDNTT